MKYSGKKTFTSILFTTLFLFAAIAQAGSLLNEEKHQSLNTEPLSLSANWLVMYYLNGDNPLNAVQIQMRDIIRAVGSTEEVQIAILHDANQQGDTKLYYVDGTDLVEQSWEEESNMADAQTIKEFVQRVRSDHTYDHDALILSSNKGSGWQGIMWDETNGDERQIQLPELSTAFAQMTNGGDETLDVLGIETCMAGMTENAYELKDYVDYYISYEDCSFAGYLPYSWPFEGPLSDLVADPEMSPEDFAITHLDYFESKRFSMNRITTVMTVTKLNELTSVKDAIDELATFLIANMNEYRDDIHAAIEETRILGELWYIDFYLDPVHFLNLLTIDDVEGSSLKQSVIDSYEHAIVACDHIEQDPVCGLSIHLPRRKADYDHSFRFDTLLSSYDNTDFAQESQWNEFLKSFLQINENSAPDRPTIDGETRGEPGTEYEFTVTATDADNDNLYLFIDWGDGNTSGWAGPFQSGEETTFDYTWSQQGTYQVRVKAKDSEESNWGLLEVRMPKRLMILPDTSSWKFLWGRISDIEYDTNQRFRFLPIQMLDLGFSVDDGLSIMIRNENNGPFPCCGYIDPEEFSGIIRSDSIFGIWKI